MSEPMNEHPRRRRRAAITEETALPPEGTAPENAPEGAAPERAPEKEPEKTPAAGNTAEFARLAQGADSRVPAEARRMNAAPYGAGGASVPRRPGTRPASGVRRPPADMPPPRVRMSPSAAAQSPYRRPEAEGEQHTKAQALGGMQARVRVGYAPGRMSEGREAPYGAPGPEPARNYPPQHTRMPVRQEAEAPRKPGARKKGRILRILIIVLVLIGAAAAALQLLPEDNAVRQWASGLTQSLFGGGRGKAVSGFSVSGDGQPAPADVTFSVTTSKEVAEIRLTDGDGRPLEAAVTLADNADEKNWVLKSHFGAEYDREVRLQIRRDGAEEWEDTAYGAQVRIDPPEYPELDVTGTPAEETGAPAEDAPDETPDETPEAADGGAEEDGTEAALPALEPTADPAQETAEPAPEATPEATPEPTAAPTPEPTAEPTPEPTPTPPLEAQAAPGANPSLITSRAVYNGSKKVSDYSRAAKELIHMPAGWDYTKVQMGVLTFRGNAFRTNGAVGTVQSAGGLTQIWERQAGSAQGASTTYYGIGWTGQPVIVKWSSQVREASNIDPEKQEKKSLKEVIIAGIDGHIRFLDLDDGSVTRNSINLGYPMRGTPSVHPGGYTYMNVGQYARRMKSKQGKIGLRQYNLYTQKELKLINGIDGKPYNRTGSFQTSALIDRTSDSMITAGNNGMLYLVSLNSEFDWQMGVYTFKPSIVTMTSKTKGQKNARTAVESSVAMYDKYVFYADMDGVLRCVDTNFLTPVWAVQTGDAVMASVALDMRTESTLDLYTANMLYNRKKGDIQIRRYDALSGREIWCVDVGVQKDTSKSKRDSGVKASPVIGEKTLEGLVYFTVTGLNDAGREKLGVPEETQAALIALEKETGKIAWTFALSDRSESSPIAVYDEEGNGWIIQCAWDGTIVMLDGLTGRKVSELQLPGNIEASPAAYNDIMVIGTTGKKTEFIYGIRIQ